MNLTKMNRLLWICITTVVCVGLDQWTKAIAKTHLNLFDTHSMFGDTVRFRLAHNTGAFLSLGESMPESIRQPIFTIGVGALLAGLLAYVLFAKHMNRANTIALALILAGGISNLGDRIVYGGYVVDFVQVGFGWLRTGVFNIADMAIMAGAFLMLIDAFRKDRADKV